MFVTYIPAFGLFHSLDAELYSYSTALTSPHLEEGGIHYKTEVVFTASHNGILEFSHRHGTYCLASLTMKPWKNSIKFCTVKAMISVLKHHDKKANFRGNGSFGLYIYITVHHLSKSRQ